MNSVLVFIELPASLPGQDYAAKRDWQELLPKLKTSAASASDATMLAENLWQIDARQNLPFLVELLYEVGKIHRPYRILPLEEGQQWLSSTAPNV